MSDRPNFFQENQVGFVQNANAGAGDEINPHMPQYIIKPPWYLNQTENSLKHQKAQVEVTKLPISSYTLKGVAEKSNYKYRSLACENCGAITHKKSACLERPRARGAKWSGKNFAGDEFIIEVPLDYEGKRDRWKGYDPNSFTRIMSEYQRYEEEKKRIKAEQDELNKNNKNNKKEKVGEGAKLGKLGKFTDEDLDLSVSSDDENNLLNNDLELPQEFLDIAENVKDKEKEYTNITDDDVVSYLDEIRKDSSVNCIADIPKEILYRMCASKSLHIGGDYSKYLINLALNSAYYDGKSRSMRENPNPDSLDHTFKGDNYIRSTGDALKLVELESFIKDANEKNKDLNLNMIAMPSQAELFHKYLNNTKDNFRTNVLKKIISKYGGEEHLQIPDGIKHTSQSLDENELNDNLNGMTKIMVKSIYPEDVYVNNHFSIWGSYYHDVFGWGYKCCLSFDKNSWCKGEEGLKENKKMIEMYYNKINEDTKKEKDKIKEKEEELKMRNLREENDGVFNEMFERMERYEQTGKVEIKNNKNEFLNKKTDRD